MSGDDAASGLGDVRSASNAGSRGAAASSSAGVSSGTGCSGTGSCRAGCNCARVTSPVGFARIQRSTTARTAKHPCAVIAAMLVAKSPLCSISRSNAATQPSRAADRSLLPAGSSSNVMRRIFRNAGSPFTVQKTSAPPWPLRIHRLRVDANSQTTTRPAAAFNGGVDSEADERDQAGYQPGRACPVPTGIEARTRRSTRCWPATTRHKGEVLMLLPCLPRQPLKVERRDSNPRPPGPQPDRPSSLWLPHAWLSDAGCSQFAQITLVKNNGSQSAGRLSANECDREWVEFG
jgi:hypothetical protein